MIKRLNLIKTLQFQQGDKSYSLSIRSVLPLVDNMTKQQKVRLSVSDAVKPLANSIGTLEWKGQQTYISSRYIVQRNGQLGLFIAQDGKAIFHPLKQAIEGQASPVNLSPKTLVITNKLLILNNKDVLN